MNLPKSSVPSFNRGLIEQFTTMALFYSKKRKNKGPFLESEIDELIGNWKRTKDADLASIVLPKNTDYMKLAMNVIDGKEEENDEASRSSNNNDNLLIAQSVEAVIKQLQSNQDCPVIITPVEIKSSSTNNDKITIAQDNSSYDFMQKHPQISTTSQEKSGKDFNVVASSTKSSHPSKPHVSKAFSDIHHVPSFLHLPTFFNRNQGQTSPNDNNQMKNVDQHCAENIPLPQHSIPKKRKDHPQGELNLNLENLFFPTPPTDPYCEDLIPVFGDDCLDPAVLEKLESTNPTAATSVNEWATDLMFSQLKRRNSKVKEMFASFTPEDEYYLTNLFSALSEMDPKFDLFEKVFASSACGQSSTGGSKSSSGQRAPIKIHEKMIGLFDVGLEEYKTLNKNMKQAFKEFKQHDDEITEKATECIQLLRNSLEKERKKKEADEEKCKTGENADGLQEPEQKKRKVGEGKASTSTQSDNVDEAIRDKMLELLYPMMTILDNSQPPHSEPKV